jgi:TRAP-type mannitol/chloroaromatic compound transport system permease large subunit
MLNVRERQAESTPRCLAKAVELAPPQVTMAHIFRAVVPYIAMSIVLLLIIIAFPAIATWLPNILG